MERIGVIFNYPNALYNNPGGLDRLFLLNLLAIENRKDILTNKIIKIDYIQCQCVIVVDDAAARTSLEPPAEISCCCCIVVVIMFGAIIF